MNRVRAIAVNSFKETIRDKVLFSILFFGLIMLASSMLMGEISVGEPQKVVVDMGLAGINIIGLLIAISVGVGLVFKEIDRKTIYILLSKPVKRWEFLMGKYLGLLLTLVLEVIIMTACLLAILTLYEKDHTTGILLSSYMTLLELMVITASAIFFSTFSTPFLSGLFTGSIFIIGHIITGVKEMIEKSGDDTLKIIVNTVYYLMPNLDKFNIKQLVPYNLPIPAGYVAISTLYAIIYSVIFLLMAAAVFQKKDF